MEKENINQKHCHSQKSLLEISLVRFRKRMLGQLLNTGNKQMEDPRQKPSGMTPKGFTLIELLVVVLIIGILAAIALPQYQKAVHNTAIRTHVFPMLTQIYHAEKLYYYTNGTYTKELDKLDFSIPSACTLKSLNDTANRKNYLKCKFENKYFRYYATDPTFITVQGGSDEDYPVLSFTIVFSGKYLGLEEGKIGCFWNGKQENEAYCARFGSKLNNQFYLVSPK